MSLGCSVHSDTVRVKRVWTADVFGCGGSAKGIAEGLQAGGMTQ